MSISSPQLGSTNGLQNPISLNILKYEKYIKSNLVKPTQKRLHFGRLGFRGHVGVDHPLQDPPSQHTWCHGALVACGAIDFEFMSLVLGLGFGFP